MQSFQILDRKEKIHQSLVLEASAGTGKTFSIEHTIVRLLLEGQPLSLDQILVVTFTRAATRDLRARIHENILFAIRCLKQEEKKGVPDYLVAILEEGPEAAHRALRRLQQAIGIFDFAQIDTIHGFCAQMLGDYLFESRFSRSSLEPDQALLIRPLIRDYFRTASSSEAISLAELNALLGYFGGDPSSLEQELANAVSQGTPFGPRENFTNRLARFCRAMHSLKVEQGWTSEKILADFAALVPFYKEICSKNRQVKPEILSRVQAFASLFDKESWEAADFHWVQADQLFLLDLFDPRQRKVSAPDESSLPLRIPGFREQLKRLLLPLVSMQELFCCLAADCIRFVEQYKQKEGVGGYDDLLCSMEKALDRPEFRSAIQRRYRAAIIDEFQDTDPVQWRIFQRLFLDAEANHACVYLVGDPKQSIYAFRQADLYTYFEAAEKIGRSQQRSLDTNFRSRPDLVDTLNFLFCDESAPAMFSLPKKNTSLKCPMVKSPAGRFVHRFRDNKGTVHFFGVTPLFSRGFSLEKCEAEGLFSFILEEVLHLVRKEGFRFDQIAILVADRFQAARIAALLARWNIPSITQKTELLTDSHAFAAIRDLLKAVIHPRDFSALKIALGGKIIGWTYSDLLSLDAMENLQRILKIVYLLRKELLERGVAPFFEMLLDTSWSHEGRVIEVLLRRKDGEPFFQDLRQIIQLLIEEECSAKCGPEGLLLFLDVLQSCPEAHESRLRRLEDAARNAVQVLTTHSSKGLEFDIVFNIGLIKRSKSSTLFVPEEKDGKRSMAPVTDETSEVCSRFYREVDAEKSRQLYVAFTRAKERLYNAVVFVEEGRAPELGAASPMELFTARLGIGCSEGFKGFVARVKDVSLTYSDVSGMESFAEPYAQETPAPMAEIPSAYIPVEPRFLHSFTSLSKGFGKESAAEQDAPSQNFFASEKTVHTLPAGAMTGNFLHECLESIPFEDCLHLNSASDLSRFLRTKVRASPFTDWEEVIYEIVFRAVKTPFIEGKALCELASNAYSRELEFLYSSDMADAKGQIKGFIDLFFFHQGKYYLLDWKSNWLGPHEGFYTQESLRAAMEKHDYFLQADLYRRALERYLKLFDPRPFSEIFGGTYYVFLRGLAAGEGVFAHRFRVVGG